MTCRVGFRVSRRVGGNVVFHRAMRFGCRRVNRRLRPGRLVMREILFVLTRVHEIRRSRHRRACVERGRHRERGQRACYVEVRSVADGERVDLPRRYQSAQHFTHLAASREGSQEQLNFLHARGNYRLQINGSQHRDRRHLRRRSSFSNGLLIAMAQKLPLGSFARRRDNWNDPQLLPQLGDRPQHGGFRHFPAKGMLQRSNCGVSSLKQLVSLHRELRNLSRTRQLRAPAPVAVAAQRVNIRQHPAGHHKIRLLARLALKVQAHCNIGRFQADQQLFGEHDVLGIGSRVPLTCYGFDKRWRY